MRIDKTNRGSLQTMAIHRQHLLHKKMMRLSSMVMIVNWTLTPAALSVKPKMRPQDTGRIV